ncbi:MAG: biotin transporter BioY [Clostridiaceae bacterium]|nr:biotin transporter BioY [Clostridiaceae bacterium]
MAFSSLFTVLIIIGGYISFPIPLSPVPIVLSDFFVMLAGLVLGAAWGCASVGLYLFLGVLGFPVFAGGKAGLAILAGPTGGFLFGYLICAFATGMVSRGISIRRNPSKMMFSFFMDLSALLAGNILLYAAGIPWLKFVLKTTWKESLTLGLLPFIPGAIIKIIFSIILIRSIQPSLTRIIVNSSQNKK